MKSNNVYLWLKFHLKFKNKIKPKSLLGKKILVGYDSWEVYSDKPFGHFMKIIGDIGW